MFCFIFRNILHSWMNFQYQKYCSNPQNLTLFKCTYLTKTNDQLTHLFYGIKTCEDFLFFMPTHIRRETTCSIKVHIIKPYEVKRDYIYAILSTYANNYILTDDLIFHNISAFWIRLYLPLVVSSGTMIVLLSVCIIEMWSVIVVMLPNLIFFLLFWRFLFITSRWVEKAAGV